MHLGRPLFDQAKEVFFFFFPFIFFSKKNVDMREIYLVIKTQKVYFFMVQQKHPLDGQTQNSFAISFDLKWEKKWSK